MCTRQCYCCFTSPSSTQIRMCTFRQPSPLYDLHLNHTLNPAGAQNLKPEAFLRGSAAAPTVRPKTLLQFAFGREVTPQQMKKKNSQMKANSPQASFQDEGFKPQLNTLMCIIRLFVFICECLCTVLQSPRLQKSVEGEGHHPTPPKTPAFASSSSRS